MRRRELITILLNKSTLFVIYKYGRIYNRKSCNFAFNHQSFWVSNHIYNY